MKLYALTEVDEDNNQRVIGIFDSIEELKRSLSGYNERVKILDECPDERNIATDVDEYGICYYSGTYELNEML